MGCLLRVSLTQVSPQRMSPPTPDFLSDVDDDADENHPEDSVLRSATRLCVFSHLMLTYHPYPYFVDEDAQA